MKGFTCVLMNLTVRFSGPCMQFGVLNKSEFITGKNSVLSAGTEHASVADPPPFTPARNHTKSRWPTMQFAPLSSTVGLAGVGIDSTHSHQSAVNDANWPGGKVPGSADVVFSGIISPKPIPTTASRCFVRSMVFSLPTAPNPDTSQRVSQRSYAL